MLIVNSLYTPFVVGGAEVVTEMLATTLAAQGHRASVVTTCARDRETDVERLHGVDVYRFFPKNRWWLYERFAAGDRRSAIEKLRWRIADAWNRDAGERFGRILQRLRPDIVHTHNIKGFSPLIWHVAHRSGIPVVHTGHSYELICANGSLLGSGGKSCAAHSRCATCRIHGAWYRAQANAIDVFCSPSAYLLRAHAEAGVAFRRSALVRNGVAGPMPPESARSSAEGRPLRFLYMGQLAPHKGIDTLLDAIVLAKGCDFAVDIAGRGDAEARVTAIAAVDHRVRFHGFVDGPRKEQLLSGADVLIFPSIWVENAPMSIAEAFRHALPVIGSRIGAIPEFVDPGVNGLLFDSGSAASLADCMSALCANPEALRRLQQGARRSGAAWPTPEVMASDYVAIYRTLLQGKTG